MADLCRDFWIRGIGTGQQVAQLHDRYMMMMMIMKSVTAELNQTSVLFTYMRSAITYATSISVNVSFNHTEPCGYFR